MTNKKIVYKPIDPKIEEIAHQHGGTREAALEVLKDLSSANNLNIVSMIDTARALHLPAHETNGIGALHMRGLNQANACNGHAQHLTIPARPFCTPNNSHAEKESSRQLTTCRPPNAPMTITRCCSVRAACYAIGMADK